MRKSRKVCLFVVEGMADRTSLALPLQNLFRHFFDPACVEFDIMNGDITADYRIKPDTIIGQLGNHIKKYLDKKKLKFDDLIQIILVVDTDGAFIPDLHVIVDERAYRKYPFYLNDSIVTANSEEQEKIQVRNHRKVSNLKRIIFFLKLGKYLFVSIIFLVIWTMYFIMMPIWMIITKCRWPKISKINLEEIMRDLLIILEIRSLKESNVPMIHLGVS